jgi:hypothetical protein
MIVQIMKKRIFVFSVLATFFVENKNDDRQRETGEFFSVRKAGLPDGLFSNRKSQLWVNFGGSFNGKSWYILGPFGLFYCYWKYFMAIWYIVLSFGIFFSVLVFCTRKNLATLPQSSKLASQQLFDIQLSFSCCA